ncbi:hypothetical protein PTTG_06016 [Puccinia triticina 1-1 BBBD Race 1]|uniref:ApbA_C domain-containing protein n=1 Tax=Puccinia triticina (isolate 1-1 / race 1 (BBBD)) TaxID=630390 RepID=A0A0C4EYW1_PUCT1|nr:hypothetical protein PTTG_06016 [Puccinia triticina 1-1 BBBD Race 1]
MARTSGQRGCLRRSSRPPSSARYWNWNRTQIRLGFCGFLHKGVAQPVNDPALLASLLKTPDDGRHPPTLVHIQNGIGFEDAHRQRHPQVPILSAVTVVNAEQLQLVASQLALHSQTRLDLLAKLFRNGQINDAEIYGKRELQILCWHKLTINTSMNPTLILSCGMASSEMVKDGGLREHLAGCMGEVFGAALKIFGLAEFLAKFASIEQILRSTERAGEWATIKPLILLDWEAGRPLETKAILGNPLHIANRAAINLAWIQSIYESSSCASANGAELVEIDILCKNSDELMGRIEGHKGRLYWVKKIDRAVGKTPCQIGMYLVDCGGTGLGFKGSERGCTYKQGIAVFTWQRAEWLVAFWAILGQASSVYKGASPAPRFMPQVILPALAFAEH